jgi:hypothetical protein
MPSRRDRYDAGRRIAFSASTSHKVQSTPLNGAIGQRRPLENRRLFGERRDIRRNVLGITARGRQIHPRVRR